MRQPAGHGAVGMLLVVGLLLGRAGFAAGSAPAPNPTEDVRALYNQGSAQYALGHFQEALKDFEKLYLLKQLPALLFNIAQCHRQMKNFEEAATTFRSFIRLAPDNPQVPTARELLVQVEAAVKAQKAAQTTPPLDVNGKDVPNDVSPVAGAKSTPPPAATVAAVTSPPPPPQPAPLQAAPAVALASPIVTAEAPAQRTRVYSWVVGGAGVAALAAGGVFGLMSKSTGSDLTAKPHSQTEIADMKDKLASQVKTANVLFAVGGGLLAVGSLLFVLRY